jgi:hypothetical protein
MGVQARPSIISTPLICPELEREQGSSHPSDPSEIEKGG